MPQVIVPPPYRGPTGGEERIEVEAATVAEALEAVDRRFPGFSTQVFDSAGRVHRFVNLFVNGEEVERGALDHPLTPADRLEILAAIAGGQGGRRSRSTRSEA